MSTRSALKWRQTETGRGMSWISPTPTRLSTRSAGRPRFFGHRQKVLSFHPAKPAPRKRMTSQVAMDHGSMHPKAKEENAKKMARVQKGIMGIVSSAKLSG